MANCDVVKKNLGLSKCNKLPGLLNGMITTPNNFSIPAATIASGITAILAYIQTAMLADPSIRVYLWPPFITFENKSVETVYQDTPLAYKKVLESKYRFLFGISENICLHKAMYSHRASNGRVILLDADDQAIGTENAAGDFLGLTYNMLNTEGFKFNDGSVVTTSPVLISLASAAELNKSGVILDVTGLSLLVRLTDVELTQKTTTTTKVKVYVATECDGTPVVGLVAGDFILKTASGTNQTITTVTEDAPGLYALNGTGLVAGTLELVAAEDLSVEGYEGAKIPIVMPLA